MPHRARAARGRTHQGCGDLLEQAADRLGPRPSQEAMEDCETLLLAGTLFPYIEFYPKPGDVRAVQIDVDPVTAVKYQLPIKVIVIKPNRK